MDKDLRPRQLTGYSRRTHLSNALFLLPTIVLFTFVVLIPFFQGIPYSFTSWKSIVSTDHPFNGIANYKYLLGNKYFRMSLPVVHPAVILLLDFKLGNTGHCWNNNQRN